MKIAICYFSATGRTAAMAEAIAGGIREAEPACEGALPAHRRGL